MREDDQRRLARAALLRDVGGLFIWWIMCPWDKPVLTTHPEMAEVRKHPRLGYDAPRGLGRYPPPEMLDVILHHHELLDGTGYPDGLRGNQISDIVRLTTIVDIHAALVEKRSYRLPFTHAKAFVTMEQMGDKLDQQLLSLPARWCWESIDVQSFRDGPKDRTSDAQLHVVVRCEACHWTALRADPPASPRNEAF